MTHDPTTPVIVGVGQIKQQPTDPATTVEAIELMIQAVEAARNDAGAPAIIDNLDQIAVVRGAWSYTDPGRLIAERFGVDDRAVTILSTDGGQTPQALLNLLARRIAEGGPEVAVMVGGESIWSRRRRRRAGLDVPKTVQDGIEPDQRFGADLAMASAFEIERGLEAPVQFYPVFESAIRAAAGESPEQHRHRLGRLWADFNQVAVANPYAWSRRPLSATEIVEPTPENRMVGFPYTKAMNSNWDVDLAAAVIVCSAAKAASLGIDRDLWIFPVAGTEANDTPAVTNRVDLHSSPAIAAAGQALHRLTGVAPDQVDHVDLYSCFPSAVQVAAQELGLGLERRLTATGGLTFAGGPLNNYVTHSIAAMVDTLRRDESPDALGLVTANGGFLTKHALGLYARSPSGRPFAHANVQDQADAAGSTPGDPGYTGPVTVEAYTVMHDHQGPVNALAALQTPNGARTWGRSADGDTMAAMVDTEMVGAAGLVDGEGTLRLDG